MSISEERMREIALAYVIWTIRNNIFSFPNFKDRVRYTARQLGISNDEATAFVEEVFERSRKDDLKEALDGPIPNCDG